MGLTGVCGATLGPPAGFREWAATAADTRGKTAETLGVMMGGGFSFLFKA